MKILNKFRPGFTLIELLIVVVIIGILSVAFLPTVLNAPKKARDATRKAHINAIVQAIQTYYSENALPTEDKTEIDSAIAKTFPNSTLPKDPGNEIDYLFKYDSTNKCFVVMTRWLDIPSNGNIGGGAGGPGDLFKTIDCTQAPSIVENPTDAIFYVTFLKME